MEYGVENVDAPGIWVFKESENLLIIGVHFSHYYLFMGFFFCELEIGKVFLKWCYIAIDAKTPCRIHCFLFFLLNEDER